MDHHRLTKAAVHHEDWDAKWSGNHILVTVAMLFVWPSHFAMPEVVAMWRDFPTSHWPERIALNLFYYIQLAIVHRMGLAFEVLLASHIGTVALFLLFHGMTHRISYYYYLNKDPSGLRHLPYVDAILGFLIPPRGWMDMKFHDVHHAFPASIGTLSARSYIAEDDQWQRVEAAVADMADEGLFLDQDGKPFAHLAECGHELGKRQRYLEAKAKAAEEHEQNRERKLSDSVLEREDVINAGGKKEQ